jgi:hypothetical protein
MHISDPTAVVASATQAPSQVQPNISLLVQSTLYSASVGGRKYPADISLSSGEYLALVPQLPGISANGSTLIAAENNLNTRISVLV